MNMQVAKSIQMAMGLHDDDVAFFLAADEPATYLQVEISSSNIAMYLKDTSFALYCLHRYCMYAAACLSRLPWPGSTVLGCFQHGLK